MFSNVKFVTKHPRRIAPREDIKIRSKNYLITVQQVIKGSRTKAPGGNTRRFDPRILLILILMADKHHNSFWSPKKMPCYCLKFVLHCKYHSNSFIWIKHHSGFQPSWCLIQIPLLPSKVWQPFPKFHLCILVFLLQFDKLSSARIGSIEYDTVGFFRLVGRFRIGFYSPMMHQITSSKTWSSYIGRGHGHA